MVVGDDPSTASALGQVLTRLGHTVCATARPGDEAIEQAGEIGPDLLLIDLDQDANGIEVAARSKSQFDLPAIYLVDGNDIELLQRAEMTTPPCGCVLKPVNEQQLAVSLRFALSICKTLREYRKRETELNREIVQARERAHLMKTIFDNISDGVVATNLKGEFILINPVSEEIAGMGSTDTSPDEWAETYGTFYPDGKTPYPSDQLPLVRAMQGESVKDVELILRNPSRPQGVRISVSSKPLFDEKGTNNGGVIVLRDVTQLKETETKLKKSLSILKDETAKIEAIINNVSDGIIATDDCARITLSNPAAKPFVWDDKTTESPSNWSEQFGIYYPDKVTPIPTHELPVVRAMRGDSVDGMEVYIQNSKFPHGVYLSVNGRPLRLSSSEVAGAVIIFRDVTEHVHAEQALIDAFSQGKLQILDTILHNIGNAINTIAIGVGSIREELQENLLLRRFSSLVRAIEAHQGDLDSYLSGDTQGRNVIPFILALQKDLATQNQELRETTERVHQMVSQIVDIVRTERSARGVAPVYTTVSLEKAIQESLKLFRDSMKRRGIDPIVDCRTAPERIWTQESRLQQMLANLFKNSIEAIDELALSSKAKVEPKIEVRAYTDEDFLLLEVSDNGIGIKEKHKRKIFSAGFTTKASGTGLGLHSIANFVIASGGDVQPLSAGIGKGTTMRVRLRLTSVMPESVVDATVSK